MQTWERLHVIHSGLLGLYLGANLVIFHSVFTFIRIKMAFLMDLNDRIFININ